MKYYLQYQGDVPFTEMRFPISFFYNERKRFVFIVKHVLHFGFQLVKYKRKRYTLVFYLKFNYYDVANSIYYILCKFKS